MRAKVEVMTPPGAKRARGPVRDLVKAILAAEKAGGQVAVEFVDEQEMAVLNGRFRGSATSTDVLSFGQAGSGEEWPDPTGGEQTELGEIAVCLPVVERYALEEGGDPATQAGWAILHGTLHLLGYDHEDDAGEMRAREQSLMIELDDEVRAVSKVLRG